MPFNIVYCLVSFKVKCVKLLSVCVLDLFPTSVDLQQNHQQIFEFRLWGNVTHTYVPLSINPRHASLHITRLLVFISCAKNPTRLKSCFKSLQAIGLSLNNGPQPTGLFCFYVTSRKTKSRSHLSFQHLDSCSSNIYTFNLNM